MFLKHGLLAVVIKMGDKMSKEEVLFMVAAPIPIALVIIVLIVATNAANEMWVLDRLVFH